MFTTMGASTKFQKHRLIFTNKNDLEFPNLKSLKQIINTFAGKDPQTQPEIAFAIIKRKMLDSDSNNSWIYLLKNLIIYDQAIQHRLFIGSFVDLDIPTINQFKEIDKRFLHFYFDGVIRKFFVYMKLKAKILMDKHTIFRIEKSSQEQLLNKLTTQQCKWCIEIVQSVFKAIFQIFQYKKYDIAQFKLIQYVFSQLLLKLQQWCYSIGLLCFTKFLNVLDTFSSSQIIVFQTRFDNFHKQVTKAIELGEQFKWIKGSKVINSKEFESSIKLIYKFINQYKQKQKKIQQQSLQHSQVFHIVKKSMYNRSSTQQQELSLEYKTTEKMAESEFDQNIIKYNDGKHLKNNVFEYEVHKMQDQQQFRLSDRKS